MSFDAEIAELSEAEVHRACQRAFFALGYPAGADEDAAWIVTWLSALNLDGLKYFFDSLPCLQDQPYCRVELIRQKSGDLLFQAKGDVGFFSAVEIVDLLCSEAAARSSSGCRSRVDGLKYPTLLIAAAMLRSNVDCSFLIRSGKLRTLVSDRRIWLNRPVEELSQLAEFEQSALQCRWKHGKSWRDEDECMVELHVNAFKDQAMRRRIVVEQAIWRKIKSQASESFVQASEYSRTRGAGAEVDDND